MKKKNWGVENEQKVEVTRVEEVEKRKQTQEKRDRRIKILWCRELGTRRRERM